MGDHEARAALALALEDLGRAADESRAAHYRLDAAARLAMETGQRVLESLGGVDGAGPRHHERDRTRSARGRPSARGETAGAPSSRVAGRPRPMHAQQFGRQAAPLAGSASAVRAASAGPVGQHVPGDAPLQWEQLGGLGRRRLYGYLVAAVSHGRSLPAGAFRGDPRHESVSFLEELAAFNGWLPVAVVAEALHVEPEAVRCAAEMRPDKLVMDADGGWVRGAAAEATWDRSCAGRLAQRDPAHLAAVRAELLLRPEWQQPPAPEDVADSHPERRE